MRKFILFLFALLCLGSVMTVKADYCVAHNGVMNEKIWQSNGDKMAQVGSTDIYKIIFENVGTSPVAFKVTDGTWDKTWGTRENAWSEIELSNDGDGNATFTLGSSSNVTIYFNSNNKKIFVYTAGNIAYTIAGAEELMGSDWNTESASGNDMTRQTDGITYTLTRENVELTTGNKEYKVVKNHAWGTGEFPTSGNYQLKIEDNGTYNVTFTYIPGLEYLTAVASLVSPPVPAEYTVLGEVPGLDWTLASTTNNMTGSGDVYTLLLEDVELAVGEYDYKIAKNHSWLVAYPQDGNDKLSIAEAGVYDVTFTLDLTATPAQSVNAVFKHASVVLPTIKMTGTFADGTNWAETVEFTPAGNNETASLTIENLPAGNYDFLVLSGSSYRGNGYTYHRDYTGAGNIIGNNGNMHLQADVAGNYTFTWTYAKDSLGIEFPSCDYYIKNNWYGCDWKWKGMTPGENGTYRVENVVYGGNGVNFNTANDDTGATWVDYSAIKYADNKVVAAYDTVNFVLDPATGTITAESINKDVTVYTVAGGELALFVQGWAPSHPYKYTEMKKQTNGTYKWTNMDEEATLCEGPIEFKVIKNGAYENGSWPDGGNYVLNVKRSGNYEIAINFNPCSKDIWVDTTFVKAVNIHGFTLMGLGDWVNGHDFTRNEYNDKALVTVSLTASETPYTFKLVDTNNNWYGNGQAFTRENASRREIKEVDGGANMTLLVDKTGEYLFTYFFETEQLVVSYPSIVPDVKIAPLSGKFTINAKGDTAIFARGNIQYNYGENAWYAAEKQYEALSDLNLRFGDNTYQGSVDLFDWSCTSSQFGLLPSNVNADYTGDFVDWGQKFAEDEKEWSTLSKDEWNYLLYTRKKGGQYLWTILGIIIAPDTINGFVLFPDEWTAPSELTIRYGFYDLDDEEKLKENAFTLAQWQQMEDAGAVFLPLAGARAGHWGNKVGIDGATLVNEPMNPLANLSYCWVDNVDWMGFYWSSTKVDNDDVTVQTPVLPGWHNSKWTAPQYWSRARRYGQSVRLVTRIPKAEYVDIRTGLTAGKYYTVCWNKTMKQIRGASLWSFIGKDADFAYIEQEGAPYPAGKPFIIYAESDKLEAILTGDEVDASALVPNNGLYGTFDELHQSDFDNIATTEGKDVYFIYNTDGEDSELRKVNGRTGNWIRAYRAYVIVDDILGGMPNPAPGRNVRSMPLQNTEAQGVENIGASEKPMKMVIDGQLYILRGEKMYDATGRVVK